MNDLDRLKVILEQTVVMRFPRRRLSTFGDTVVQYHLITPHPEMPDRSTLRTGEVKMLRPKILTPEALARHFEGFGEDGDGFERLLKDQFAASFRGLEYVFQNRLDLAEDRRTPAADLARAVRQDLDEREALSAAVIHGPAWGWPLSLMKFVLEETGRSFPVHIRELAEHGLFDPAGTAERRGRAEVERLFREAKEYPERLQLLAAKLKELGLFEEHQDRFFSLIRK